MIDFMDSDEGTIVARTCTKLIIFPRNIFVENDADSYEKFKFCMAMNAIIDFDLKGLQFNTI